MSRRYRIVAPYINRFWHSTPESIDTVVEFDGFFRSIETSIGNIRADGRDRLDGSSTTDRIGADEGYGSSCERGD